MVSCTGGTAWVPCCSRSAMPSVLTRVFRTRSSLHWPCQAVLISSPKIRLAQVSLLPRCSSRQQS